MERFFKILKSILFFFVVVGNRHGKITELSEWMDDHWSERGNGERERSLFLFCTRIGQNCNISIVDMFAFIVLIMLVHL